VSTRFLVKRATHLSGVNAFVLDGVLVSGELAPECSLCMATKRAVVSVRIRSVALVNESVSAPRDARLMTVQIYPPSVAMEELVGQELVSSDLLPS
jgi:hypothetical protein